MQLGLCTSFEALADAAQAGFDFAELPVSALAIDQSAADFEAVRRRILAAAIPLAIL
ncbi:MAG: hypothetical protein HYV35_09920 [Lentisphaerae bacterium]|nr:hypothetical protein [Lentisphaerota bacterium]